MCFLAAYTLCLVMIGLRGGSNIRLKHHKCVFYFTLCTVEILIYQYHTEKYEYNLTLDIWPIRLSDIVINIFLLVVNYILIKFHNFMIHGSSFFIFDSQAHDQLFTIKQP